MSLKRKRSAYDFLLDEGIISLESLVESPTSPRVSSPGSERKLKKVKTSNSSSSSFSFSDSASGSVSSSKKKQQNNANADIVKVGLCQIKVGTDKVANIAAARNAVIDAASKGCDLVVLPECFNCPYAVSEFANYAEVVPSLGKKGFAKIDVKKSPTCSFISKLAKEYGIFLVAGSIPESQGKKLYNTCIVANPDGKLIAKHRKVHLFDINIPGKMTFQESKTLSGGAELATFDSPWGKIGLGICYDLRFPEWADLLRQEGCRMLIYPGAFNQTTGPLHWELLLRARACDNQCFVLGCSPAADKSASYVAYGHSTVVDPWAKVLQTTSEEEAVVIVDCDMTSVNTVRKNIPCLSQKRNDLYSSVEYLK